MQARRFWQPWQRFNDVSEADDAHQEHDFGAFDYQGNTVFCKIDYCADDHCEWGPEAIAIDQRTEREQQ
jgi:hypothetical protein